MGKIFTGKPLSSCYTKIPNNLIRNCQISDSTFKFICWICSHQEGFNISFASINSSLGYGRDKLRKILKEAEEANHLVRQRIHLGDGTFDWDYHVFLDTEDAIAYRESIDLKHVDGKNDHVGQTRNMVHPSVAEPEDGSRPPYIKEQLEKDQNKKDQLEETPLTPQNFEGGGETQVLSEGESVLGQTRFSTTQNPESLHQAKIVVLEQNLPARENDSRFEPITGKNPKTGKEYFPWQGMVYEQNRSRHANNPGFLAFVARSLSGKYSMYKKMPVSELQRETEKYVNRAQHNRERLEEIEGYWRDFVEDKPQLPDVTVEDIKQMSVKSRLMALLGEAEQRKATGASI